MPSKGLTSCDTGTGAALPGVSEQYPQIRLRKHRLVHTRNGLLIVRQEIEPSRCPNSNFPRTSKICWRPFVVSKLLNHVNEALAHLWI